MDFNVSLKTAPVLTKLKKTYLAYNYLHTILGGYRFSSKEDNLTISPSVHVLQLLIYAIFPGSSFAFGMVIN